MKKPRVQTSTSARVTITLEISNVGSWGPGCEIDQVYRQAIESAVGRLNRAFKDDIRGIRIVGQPSVDAITTSMDKK